MGRRTVTLDEEAEAIIEEKVEEGDACESVSALVRESLKKYDRAEGLRDRVDELEDELVDVREQRDWLQERVDDVEDMEREIERLQNEKRMLLAEREEKAELARYVEDERETQQRWREAPMWTRIKWRVVGMPSMESA